MNMCYYLYGAVNKEVNSYDFGKVSENSRYSFSTGSINDVLDSVNKNNLYRLNNGCCDCGTALGSGHTKRSELLELKKFLLNCKYVRDIKYILLLKHWWSDDIEKQETVHIDDIDVLSYLAKIEDNCVYKIELYPRYY